MAFVRPFVTGRPNELTFQVKSRKWHSLTPSATRSRLLTGAATFSKNVDSLVKRGPRFALAPAHPSPDLPLELDLASGDDRRSGLVHERSPSCAVVVRHHRHGSPS